MLKANYYTEPTELDQLIFEKLVPANHYLRKVKVAIDFARFRKQVRDCYDDEMGRQAEDPARMIKLEYLEIQYNLSDREVIADAQVNVAFRFFLDLSLESALPVPSLLSQFRTRLGVDRHETILNDLVAQARAYGLVKDRLRLKDATHIIANIAVPSTIQLVAQTRTRLLESARPYAPQQVSADEATAEQIRAATADLSDTERLVQRVKHLRQIVPWADELQTTLGAVPQPVEPTRQRFDEALALAHKVLADRAQPKAKDQVRSVVDSEARRNKHGEWYDGYLVDMSLDADSELITAINVLPANADEAADAHHLIASEEQAQGNDVQALSIDGAGFRGEILRDLSDPAGLALDVYVPPSAPTSSGDYFTPADFQLDSEGTLLRCPAEQEATDRHRAPNERGWVFTFKCQQCAGCPLLKRCMAKSPHKHGRTVLKNDYEAEYATARAKAQTPEYQAVRVQHPRIERKWAELVRRHDLRHARYRGRLRVKIQALLSAIVVNIKRIVHLLTDTPRDESALALG